MSDFISKPSSLKLPQNDVMKNPKPKQDMKKQSIVSLKKIFFKPNSLKNTECQSCFESWWLLDFEQQVSTIYHEATVGLTLAKVYSF
jgi:hypothetical protein